MNSIKLGVIGVGAMGMQHAENVFSGRVPGMVLHAVSDPSEARRAASKTRFPGVHALDTEEALLSSGVEAVILAGPHSLHGPQAINALSRGIHVLSEKPLGIRASEAARAVEIAGEKNLVYCVMFNLRAMAIYQKIKSLLDEGAIGAMRRTLMIKTDCYRPQSYYDSGAWRATWRFEGGGMLVNQCSHWIDLLQWWFGMPSRVNAQIGYGKWHDIEVDDDISIHFDYPGGGTTHFIASTGDVPGTSLLEIQGSLGKIAVSQDGSWLSIHRLDISEEEFSQQFTGGLGAPGVTVENLSVDDADRGHLLVLRNFSDCVCGGASPIAPAADALKSLRMTQAVYLSSWLDQSAQLPISDALFDVEMDKRIAVSKPRQEKFVNLDFAAEWQKKQATDKR